jgi:hypothetical protein
MFMKKDVGGVVAVASNIVPQIAALAGPSRHEPLTWS